MRDSPPKPLTIAVLQAQAGRKRKNEDDIRSMQLPIRQKVINESEDNEQSLDVDGSMASSHVRLEAPHLSQAKQHRILAPNTTSVARSKSMSLIPFVSSGTNTSSIRHTTGSQPLVRPLNQFVQRLGFQSTGNQTRRLKAALQYLQKKTLSDFALQLLENMQVVMLADSEVITLDSDEPLDLTTPEARLTRKHDFMRPGTTLLKLFKFKLEKLAMKNEGLFRIAFNVDIAFRRHNATDIKCFRTFILGERARVVHEDGPSHACKVCRDYGYLCIRIVRIYKHPDVLEFFATVLPLAPSYRSEAATWRSMNFYRDKDAPYMMGAL